MNNYLTIESAFKAIIMSLLCYQVYDYTNQYLKYKTVVKMELKYLNEDRIPSVTICSRDHSWKFVDKKRLNYTYYGYLKRIIRYKFLHLDLGVKSRLKDKWWTLDLQMDLYSKSHQYYWDDDFFYETMTDLIISNISEYKCLTLFSMTQFKIKKLNLMKKKIDHRIAAQELSITLSMEKTNNISFYLMIHSADSMISSIPMETYLQELYWYQIGFGTITRHLLPPPYDTNCYDYDQDLINGKMIESNNRGLLKENCLIQRFELKSLISVEKTDSISTDVIIYFNQPNEHFYYLPALDFINYFNSIGGVLSFWCGISIWTFIIRIEKKLKQFSKNVHITKHIKYSKVIICAILILFSIVQICFTLEKYFNYDYRTQIETDVQLVFPKMNWIKFYAVHANNNLNKNTPTEQNISVQEIYLNPLFNSFSVSCEIIVNNDIKTKRDCGMYYDDKSYMDLFQTWNDQYPRLRHFILLIKQKNESFFPDYKANPILIIKFNYNPKIIESVWLGLNKRSAYSLEIEAKLNRTETFSFTQRSIQFLPPPFKTRCAHYQYNDSQDICNYNCKRDILYANFACVFYRKYDEEYKINWCDLLDPSKLQQLKNNHTLYESCDRTKCLTECDNNVYEYLLLSRTYGESEEAILKIVPAQKPHIKYICNEKMDFDELIYEIGGIVGLWLGSSVFSLINKVLAISNKISIQI